MANFLQRRFLSSTFLEKLAQRGDSRHQYDLAINYLRGINGVDKNNKEAVKWMRSSAAQGYPDAENELAKMVLSGKFVKKNVLEAFRLFSRAAEKGHIEAAATAGRMISRGHGVTANAEEAFRLLSKAAKKGNFKAMCDLGFMYAKGDFTQKDPHIALRLAEKSGDPFTGNLGLSQRLAGSLQSSRNNFVKAKEWLSKSAEGGDVEGMGLLGRLSIQRTFFKKNGGEINKGESFNYEEGKYWLKKAADMGNREAQRDFGFVCIDGKRIGLNQDTKNGIFYLSTSGLFGMPDSYLRLAEVYSSGEEKHENIKKDVDKARENLKLSRKTARENNLPTLKIKTWHRLRDDPRNIQKLFKLYEDKLVSKFSIPFWFGGLNRLSDIGIE